MRLNFDTKKINRKYREILPPLSVVPNKEKFSFFSGFGFSLFINIRDWTEAKHYCKAFGAAVESPDAKDTYSWLSSA